MTEKKLTDSVLAEVEKQYDDALFQFAEYSATEAEMVGYSNYSYWQSTWQSFLKNKIAVFLMVIVIILVGFTIIQPYLPNQYSPTVINISEATKRQLRNIPPRVKLLEDLGLQDLGSGMSPYVLNKIEDKYFWFGTNAIGQDLWARIWSGTRTSLLIGVIVGFSELILGRWTQMSRFVRNLIIIIRDREYNLASRCLGTPTSRIITKNLLPYLVSVIMLRLALAIPLAIGSEVFLTYIGIGLPVDMPSLGNLINEGRVFIMVPSLRYQLLFPAVILSLITISFYVIGNAFADAADPKNHV